MAGKTIPMVLASASPRRRQLLAQAGYEFTVCVPEVDESAFRATGIDPCEYARRAALAKARNAAGRFPDSIVIGADTVVDFDGQIIGKPRDAKHAEQIIRKLFSKPHKVVTAVALVGQNRGIEIVESDATTVYPKQMSEGQLAEHINSGSWQDKAGAYAIQENGDQFVEKIDGSLTNVMGLPMELLERMLDRIRPE